MKFYDLALIFEHISTESSRITITKLLAQAFAQADAEEARMITYMVLGQLRPPYKGTQFNLAEKTLVKIIAEVVHLSVEEVKRHAEQTGDLGIVLKSHTWQRSQDLPLVEVYQELIVIEKISGAGAQESKSRTVKKLLQSLDSLSASYVVRIILGKLRLGFSEMTILDALSWMAAGTKSLRKTLENAYNICTDIGLIAYTLKKEGQQAVKNLHIRVGTPIRPAAAERLPSAEAIINKIGLCIAEPKLDGFRLQIHLDKSEAHAPRVAFFSRNLQDMSPMFPEITEAVSKLSVKNIICEGEAIVYDEQTESFVPFQETVKRKRKYGIESMAQELPLKVFLFDIIYLNDHSLLEKTTQERRAVLEQLMHRAHSPTLMLIPAKTISSASDLEEYFLHALETGLEGLVVKKPSAPYQAGKRNFNWIKLKRVREGHLADTIDCVVLGYYYGKGKRAAFGIGAFLVGVYDPHDDTFKTVAKIGTGLKDADWRELKQKCDALKTIKQPHNVICAPELIPDIWVVPEIVCIIYADEITCSPLHSAGKTAKTHGFALRFPRFIGYRPDKKAIEATTVEEIISLFKLQYAQVKKAACAK